MTVFINYVNILVNTNFVNARFFTSNIYETGLFLQKDRNINIAAGQ